MVSVFAYLGLVYCICRLVTFSMKILGIVIKYIAEHIMFFNVTISGSVS